MNYFSKYSFLILCKRKQDKMKSKIEFLNILLVQKHFYFCKGARKIEMDYRQSEKPFTFLLDSLTFSNKFLRKAFEKIIQYQEFTFHLFESLNPLKNSSVKSFFLPCN